MTLYLDYKNTPIRCPICLIDIETDDILVTPCQHHFHESCFSQYCKSQKKKVISCPSCKTTHVGNVTVQSSCPNKKQDRNKRKSKQNKENVNAHSRTLKNRSEHHIVPRSRSRSQSRSQSRQSITVPRSRSRSQSRQSITVPRSRSRSQSREPKLSSTRRSPLRSNFRSTSVNRKRKPLRVSGSSL
jgi:hypothetical protein